MKLNLKSGETHLAKVVCLVKYVEGCSLLNIAV
jgi:hypothetical protein